LFPFINKIVLYNQHSIQKAFGPGEEVKKMTKLNPYIHFKDTAREAMEFYKSVFGGELTLSTFKEGGGVQDGPHADKIMHAMLVVGPEITLMAADTPPEMEYGVRGGMSISLSGETTDEEQLKGYWEKLSTGATITVPMETAPWGDTFGMLTDKFGIDWMVNISGKKA
jgi:PhnB protein